MARDPRRGRPATRNPGRGRTKPKPAAADSDVAIPRIAGVTSVVLQPGKITPVLAGHPWVYSGAIARTLPPLGLDEGEVAVPGGPCIVFDPAGRYLGFGHYNVASQITVRVVAVSAEDEEAPKRLPTVGRLVRDRLDRAIALRRDLGLPGPADDAYRLVNSEGDGLPGIVVDCFGDGAVVSISTAGGWLWRSAVVAALTEPKGAARAWVLVRVAGDCHPSEGLMAGLHESHGAVPDRVSVRHAGVEMGVDPQGQKTGMFLDQRDNRVAVAQLARGRFVVDAYCHTGGFGLTCASAGARKVLCVDASLPAIEQVRGHADRLGVSDRLRAEQGDAIHVLQSFADQTDDNERPSLVIVDPPKFATRADVISDALRKYTHLNRLAMEALVDDGWLVSCSCSGRVSEQDFLRMLALAARRAGRSLTLVELRGAARDHPVSPAHPEARYLKVAFCRVRRTEAAVKDS